MADIRYQIFEQTYHLCKALMVADASLRVSPKSVPVLSALDSEALPASERLLRYIRAGNEDITNLKQMGALPALMLSPGSGEFTLQRPNISGDLPPRVDRPRTVLGTEPERLLLTLRLALTELPRTELFGQDGTELNLEKSRAARSFLVQNQLDYVLDSSNFMALTQARPGYTLRSEVLTSKIISTQNIESDTEDTLIDFHFQVIFKRQILRS